MSMLDKLLLKGKSDNGDGGCGGDGYGRVGERSGERGFTIVEVMIVIGIGALVAVLVLVAATALQRNARNTSRQNDIGAIQGQLVQYSANRNGNLPATATELKNVLDALELGFYDQTLNNTAPVIATTANGETRQVRYVHRAGSTPPPGASSFTPSINDVHIVTGAKCVTSGVTKIPANTAGTATIGYVGSTTALIETASSRFYAIVWAIEGEATVFCRDNE